MRTCEVMSSPVVTVPPDAPLRKDEVQALQPLAVNVTGGVVTIDAAAGPLAASCWRDSARTVPGVVEVRTTQWGAGGAKAWRGHRW